MILGSTSAAIHTMNAIQFSACPQKRTLGYISHMEGGSKQLHDQHSGTPELPFRGTHLSLLMGQGAEAGTSLLVPDTSD